MRLESGPAKADAGWQAVRALIFLGFALYFVYDGAFGYREKNRAAAEKFLGAPRFSGKVKVDGLGEVPDKRDFDRLLQTKPTNAEQIRQAWGKPTLVDEKDEFFFSRYGYVQVPVTGGRVSITPNDWHAWNKTKDEIRAQFLWAIIPAAIGLFFVWKLIKALMLRVVIDDEGMTYAGRRIAFTDMVSLRDYSPKGWIDLYYKVGAAEKKLRLDNEKILLFDEAVAAICAAKHFKNEVQVYAEHKARELADEQAAAEAEAAVDDKADKDQPPG